MTLSLNEMPSSYLGIGKFRPYFNDLPVKIMIYHQALEHLTSGRHLSACMIRWTLSLNEFNTIVDYRPCCTYTVADCLSSTPKQEIDIKEEIGCSLLTSWVIQSRQQIMEEQRKDT